MAFVPTSMLGKINDSIAAALKRKLDANGVRNDATTTDAGYVLDARMGKTLGDRAEKLELKVGDLYFDTDSSGRWGYKSSKNGAVTPFRNPTGNAEAGDVLSGKTFSSAAEEDATGTMPNRGELNVTLKPDGNNATSQSVAAGYYSGGTIKADGTSSYSSGYTNGQSHPHTYVFDNGQSVAGHVPNYQSLSAANFAIYSFSATAQASFNVIRDNANSVRNDGLCRGPVSGGSGAISYNASTGVASVSAPNGSAHADAGGIYGSSTLYLSSSCRLICFY